MLIGFEWV